MCPEFCAHTSVVKALVRLAWGPLSEAQLLRILIVKATLAIPCTCSLFHVSRASVIQEWHLHHGMSKGDRASHVTGHKGLQGHQAITHHQPAGPQEKDNPKNVDHAGREHTIPGSEQHWLPYKQLGLPPGLGLGQGPLETEHTDVSSVALGRASEGKEESRGQENSALKHFQLTRGSWCAHSQS